MYRIAARYLRTETEGPLFERMKAKLAGIASHTGMSGVFRLRGADVYAVDRVEQVAGPQAPEHAAGRHQPAVGAAPLRRSAWPTAADLDSLVERLLDGVAHDFGIRHAMLLMLDAGGQRLYTVASRGYGRSGAGSEIPLGDGVIGVAARRPRRSASTMRRWSTRYVAHDARRRGRASCWAARSRCPGWPSRAASSRVPLACGGRLLGVLYVESPQDLRFGWDDEDALAGAGGAGGGAMARAVRPAPKHRTTRRADRRSQRCRRAAGAGRAAARAALRGRRQRLPRRRLPDQGRGRRDPVEAAARPRRARPHRVQQPRAAPGARDRPARGRRQPRGAAGAADAAPGRPPGRRAAARRPAAAASGCA